MILVLVIIRVIFIIIHRINDYQIIVNYVHYNHYKLLYLSLVIWLNDPNIESDFFCFLLLLLLASDILGITY
jgi:hypothetical protein